MFLHSLNTLGCNSTVNTHIYVFAEAGVIILGNYYPRNHPGYLVVFI